MKCPYCDKKLVQRRDARPPRCETHGEIDVEAMARKYARVSCPPHDFPPGHIEPLTTPVSRKELEEIIRRVIREELGDD